MRAVISGLGAVTSVGRSAAAACAAIQAGVSRPRKIAWYRVLDEYTQTPVPLTAHALKGYTDGFTLAGRWVRLARGALGDLLRNSHLPAPSDTSFWGRTGLFVVCPFLDGERFQGEYTGPADFETAVVAPLREAFPLPFAERFIAVVGVGHAGVAQAAARGLDELARGRLERVLILAVDSYVDRFSLQWLEGLRRLKGDENPVGLIPGEAAACVLLESEASVNRRHGQGLGMLSAVELGQEQNHFFNNKPNPGRALARCVHAVLDAVTAKVPFTGDLYSDLNGEPWRSQEWGSALPLLSGYLGAVRLNLPCVAVGDVGAASGAMGLCLAAHALLWSQARQERILILSSNEDGHVGCMAVETQRGVS